MNHPHPFSFGRHTHQRSLELRETVTALFTPLRDASMTRLPEFSEREWRRNLMWLDASGLALYLISELEQLNRVDLLPPFLVARLQQNLADNRKRTAWLFEEVELLNREYHRAGVRFANLKGFALGPESVPDAALRNQLDLDFAVAAEDAPRAAEVLAKHGYELHAIAKNAWEFKACTTSMATIQDLYKPRPQRNVELHLASMLKPIGEEANLLAAQLQRAEMRPMRGRLLSGLGAADVFLNQCTHLFGHFCSEFTRSSWGLELARHIRARHDDGAFWVRVVELAEGSRESVRAIAVSLIAVEDLYFVSAPAIFRSWAMREISPAMMLWAHRYGRSALLSDYPGTKFHLLLQELLPPVADEQGVTQTKRRLIPLKLPPMVMRGTSGETLRTRMRRYHAQLDFLRFRARFHLLQGLRFAVERHRWRVLTSCKGMTFRQPAHDNPLIPRS